jgi:PAS domain-containing protein
MTIGALPLLLTSLLVYSKTGWKISVIPVIVGLTSIPVIYFIRKKINYLFKFIYLLVISYIGAILILHDYNFIGSGVIILSSITLISTLFWGLRTGWAFMTVNIFFIALFSILHQYNFINYNFSFNKFIQSPFTWFDHIITFLFFIGIVVIASGQIHEALVKMIMQSRVEKENFENIFNNIQDSIIIYTYNGRILEMNRSLLEMYGVDRSSALKGNAYQFFELEPHEIDIEKISICSKKY